MRHLFFLGVFFVATVCSGNELQMNSEKDQNGQLVITMQNKFLAVEVMPERGGRICSFIDKRSGNQHVYWQHDKKQGLGGLLDDQEPRTEQNYQYSIEKNKDSLSLTLSCKQEHLEFTKTLILRENSPLIRANYTVSNHGQKNIGRLQTRNFVISGGGKVTQDDVYFIPGNGCGWGIRLHNGLYCRGLSSKLAGFEFAQHPQCPLPGRVAGGTV